jgi:hypothetical protein
MEWQGRRFVIGLSTKSGSEGAGREDRPLGTGVGARVNPELHDDVLGSGKKQIHRAFHAGHITDQERRSLLMAHFLMRIA